MPNVIERVWSRGIDRDGVPANSFARYSGLVFNRNWDTITPTDVLRREPSTIRIYNDNLFAVEQGVTLTTIDGYVRQGADGEPTPLTYIKEEYEDFDISIGEGGEIASIGGSRTFKEYTGISITYTDNDGTIVSNTFPSQIFDDGTVIKAQRARLRVKGENQLEIVEGVAGLRIYGILNSRVNQEVAGIPGPVGPQGPTGPAGQGGGSILAQWKNGRDPRLEQNISIGSVGVLNGGLQDPIDLIDVTETIDGVETTRQRRRRLWTITKGNGLENQGSIYFRNSINWRFSHICFVLDANPNNGETIYYWGASRPRQNKIESATGAWISIQARAEGYVFKFFTSTSAETDFKVVKTRQVVTNGGIKLSGDDEHAVLVTSTGNITVNITQNNRTCQLHVNGVPYVSWFVTPINNQFIQGDYFGFLGDPLTNFTDPSHRVLLGSLVLGVPALDRLEVACRELRGTGSVNLASIEYDTLYQAENPVGPGLRFPTYFFPGKSFGVGENALVLFENTINTSSILLNNTTETKYFHSVIPAQLLGTDEVNPALNPGIQGGLGVSPFGVDKFVVSAASSNAPERISSIKAMNISGNSFFQVQEITNFGRGVSGTESTGSSIPADVNDFRAILGSYALPRGLNLSDFDWLMVEFGIPRLPSEFKNRVDQYKISDTRKVDQLGFSLKSRDTISGSDNGTGAESVQDIWVSIDDNKPKLHVVKNVLGSDDVYEIFDIETGERDIGYSIPAVFDAKGFLVNRTWSGANNGGVATKDNITYFFTHGGGVSGSLLAFDRSAQNILLEKSLFDLGSPTTYGPSYGLGSSTPISIRGDTVFLKKGTNAEAYTLSTGERDTTKDITTNITHQGFYVTSDKYYVVARNSDGSHEIRVYLRSNNSQITSETIPLSEENGDPRGLAIDEVNKKVYVGNYDGTFVSDFVSLRQFNLRVYVYDIDTSSSTYKQDVSGSGFKGVSSYGNTDGRSLYVNKDRVYVAGGVQREVFIYDRQGKYLQDESLKILGDRARTGSTWFRDIHKHGDSMFYLSRDVDTSRTVWKVYAINFNNGARQPILESKNLTGVSNSLNGLFVDDNRYFILDNISNKIQVYRRDNGARVESEEVTLANKNWSGIWADSTYFYLVNNSDERIDVYNRSTRAIDASKQISMSNEFSGSITLPASGSLCGHGGTVYCLSNQGHIFAYNTANGSNISSGSLQSRIVDSFTKATTRKGITVFERTEGTGENAVMKRTFFISDAFSNFQKYNIEQFNYDERLLVAIDGINKTNLENEGFRFVNDFDAPHPSGVWMNEGILDGERDSTLSVSGGTSPSYDSTMSGEISSATENSNNTVTIRIGSSTEFSNVFGGNTQAPNDNSDNPSVTWSLTFANRTYTWDQGNPTVSGKASLSGSTFVFNKSPKTGGAIETNSTLYVLDDYEGLIYAYNKSDSKLNYEKIIKLDSSINDNPKDLFSDGSTIWVSNASIRRQTEGDNNSPLVNDSKLLGYSLSTGSRDSTKDITLDSTNASPQGVWANSTHIYVNDILRRKVFAYHVQDAAPANPSPPNNNWDTLSVSDWDGSSQYPISSFVEHNNSLFQSIAAIPAPSSNPSPPNSNWTALSPTAFDPLIAYPTIGTLVTSDNRLFSSISSISVPSPTKTYTPQATWQSGVETTADRARWVGGSDDHIRASDNELTGDFPPSNERSGTWRIRKVGGSNAAGASVEGILSVVSTSGGIVTFRVGTPQQMQTAFGNENIGFDGGEWHLERVTTSSAINPNPEHDTTRWSEIVTSEWSGTGVYNQNAVVTITMTNGVDYYRANSSITVNLNQSPNLDTARWSQISTSVWSGSVSYPTNTVVTVGNLFYRSNTSIPLPTIGISFGDRDASKDFNNFGANDGANLNVTGIWGEGDYLFVFDNGGDTRDAATVLADLRAQNPQPALSGEGAVGQQIGPPGSDPGDDDNGDEEGDDDEDPADRDDYSTPALTTTTVSDSGVVTTRSIRDDGRTVVTTETKNNLTSYSNILGVDNQIISYAYLANRLPGQIVVDVITGKTLTDIDARFDEDGDLVGIYGFTFTEQATVDDIVNVNLSRRSVDQLASDRQNIVDLGTVVANNPAVADVVESVTVTQNPIDQTVVDPETDQPINLGTATANNPATFDISDIQQEAVDVVTGEVNQIGVTEGSNEAGFGRDIAFQRAGFAPGAFFFGNEAFGASVGLLNMHQFQQNKNVVFDDGAIGNRLVCTIKGDRITKIGGSGYIRSVYAVGIGTSNVFEQVRRAGIRYSTIFLDEDGVSTDPTVEVEIKLTSGQFFSEHDAFIIEAVNKRGFGGRVTRFVPRSSFTRGDIQIIAMETTEGLSTRRRQYLTVEYEDDRTFKVQSLPTGTSGTIETGADVDLSIGIRSITGLKITGQTDFSGERVVTR